MKSIVFLGDSRDCLRAFPENARLRAGFELREVQKGNEPTSWKSMKSIGPGVREIRIRTHTGAYRVIYVLALEESVVVLHAVSKKSEKTARNDLEVADARFKALRGNDGKV